MGSKPPKQVSSASLAALLERSLAQPGITTGQRLKPERELAEMLNVSHATVHRALNRLVENRLLARRHGSGTFVRKPSASAPGRTQARTKDVLAAHLLVCETLADPKLQAPATQQALDIGLWTDIYWNSATHDLIVSGMQRRASELGHRLSTYSLVVKADTPHTPQELARVMADHPIDGHIVFGSYAPLFAATGQHAPAIYYGGEPPPEFYPSIQFDVDVTPRRAVELLAGQGYRRIAMALSDDKLGIHDHTRQHTRISYETGMQRLGLRYRKIIATRYDDAAAMAAALPPSGHPAAPDALFVSDDYLLEGILSALEASGHRPGLDFGLITLSHRGGKTLPLGMRWSTLEFDPEQYGEILVGRIVSTVQASGSRPVNLSLHPLWKPGDSHRRNGRL